MLTMEALNAYGADAKEGLTRCFGSEAFYLDLVSKVAGDQKFDRLFDAVARRDLIAAGRLADALRETVGNLSLTPMVDLLDKMSFGLRLQGDNAVLDHQAGQLRQSLETLRAIIGGPEGEGTRN